MSYGPDAEADPASFDAKRFIDRASDELGHLGINGVVSSSDYPGCLLAAFVARHLGLPGPAPAAVLRAAHKYFARESMAESVPEATPPFHLLDPARLGNSELPLMFPVFVKPVKSWFSQLAQRVDSFTDLIRYAASDEVQHHLQHFVKPFNQLLAEYPEFSQDAGYLIAEAVLVGEQVTVEGYAYDGDTTILAITDSQMHAGTGSFARFAMPSVVSDDQASALIDLTDRAIRGLGITHGLFNVEFIYDTLSGHASIVEVNPRMCGQFADLTEHVTGVNTYEVLFNLGLGRRPPPLRSSSMPRAGASYPIRRFGDAYVVSVPSDSRLSQLRRSSAATLIEVYYKAGEHLSDRRKHFDGASYRYACINVVGESKVDLDARALEVERQLGIELASTS